MGTPSNSTGAALIAGVFVSMSVVCDATAGDVLCGNVFDRLTGDIGTDVDEDEGAGAALGGTGGEMGVGDAILSKCTRFAAREVGLRGCVR